MPTDREISGQGFRVIFHGGTVQKKVREAIVNGLNDAGYAYLDAVKKNISLDDHSLAELRVLGSPYSTRSPGNTLHGDDRLVHTQSGELLEGIQMKEATRDGSGFSVHILSQAPYTDFLLNGTSKMRPRKFDEKALEDVGADRLFDSLKSRLSTLNYRIERVE